MLPAADVFAQKMPVPVIWKVAGELPVAKGSQVSLGLAGPVTGIHKNILFIGGGANFPDSMPWQGGKKRYYNSLFLFKKKGTHLVLQSNNFNLPANIAYAASCSTPQGVFFAGGENEKGATKNAFLLKWNTINKVVVLDSLPPLPVSLTNAAAVSDGNSVYVAGGEYPTGVSNKCWTLNLGDKEPGWKELSSLPRPVSHAVFIAIGTKETLKLYLIGGRRKTSLDTSELYNSVYELNVSQNQWKELSPLPYPLSAGTGVKTKTGNIVLFGGDRGVTFSEVENYIARIKRSLSQSEKDQLTKQKNKTLENHPGFSKEILFYDIATGSTRIVGTMNYPAPVTTSAVLWGKFVCIPSGEIRAGVRSPKILMTTLPHL